MNKKMKLSIIVPVYNGEKRIEKCLQSIFQQTYQDIEVIVIDDGSKDASWELINKVVEQKKPDYIEVRTIQQENHGVAYTRNYGISIAAGEYVTFIDQDDYILPEYCTTYMQAAEKNDSDIVIGGFERITDEGEVTRTVSLEQASWSKFFVTAPWAHIYRMSFIRENGVQFLTTGIGEDIYFNLVAYAYTDKIMIIVDHSYMWVDNPVSVSNSRQNSINEKSDPLYLLNKLAERLPRENMLGKEYEEYFFMRYIVWYFSFTVRGSRKEDVEQMYEQLMQWLRQHYPSYRKNPNIWLGRPKGDTASIRIGVWLFYILERFGLAKGCLKLLAKKK